MRSWLLSVLCFAPLAGMPWAPALLRPHLPAICALAWAASAALILAPRRLGFARLLAGLILAQCLLGILRLPWRHPWDAMSYWIAVGTFPAFAAGLHHALRHLLGEARASLVLASLVAVWLFPVKLAFRLAGADLPPTPIASPLALLLLAGGAPLALKAWRDRRDRASRPAPPGTAPAPGGGR